MNKIDWKRFGIEFICMLLWCLIIIFVTTDPTKVFLAALVCSYVNKKILEKILY